ncbi:glycosyltransferase family 4 protein [Algoriphagus sp. A40]|uniref:glycosyltransferase family 4 protein n=1 Tax=Algoriphagus sp. A40 TaxID=1945863 RepID=UPI0009869FCB|nr:glycosyltransferase family 4 protein [Algoriphagus sp. A40]OOG74604.1 hypothetical protein B0E43_11425 [Algoriphagus sp. A40]
MERIKVLISGFGLPPQVLGSWLYRIHRFQSELDYFDFVLSPTQKADEKYVFCEKQAPKIWHRFLNPNSRNSKAASQYVAFCNNISQNGVPVQILVMDDVSLLQGITSLKGELPIGSEIVFSFHGHWLSIPPSILEKVDKVLFLTKEGYRKTLSSNSQFTPQAFIVGNGVENEFFYPLNPSEKSSLRKSLGFEEHDTVLVWMANSRRVKGLHLFKKVASKILEKYPDVKIVSIGHTKDAEINHPNWTQVGVLSHKQLPAYLQIGDVYFFTSLWQEGFGLSLVEAIKCGNWALASDAGGIPEVLFGESRAIIVNDPNILESWLESYELVLSKIKSDNTPFIELKERLSDWQTYDTWKTKFLNALES